MSKTDNEKVNLLVDNFEHWIFNSIPRDVDFITHKLDIEPKEKVVSDELIFSMRVVCCLIEKFFEERGQHLPVGDMTDEERVKISKRVLDTAMILTPYIEQAIDASTVKQLLNEVLKGGNNED